MFISRFQLWNYKSFAEPETLNFTEGFNIVSGQNNSGKTALLEAMGLTFSGIPHRSLVTVPSPDISPDSPSIADTSFTLPPDELKELLRAASDSTYILLKPKQDSDFARKIRFTDDSAQSADRLLRGVFSESSLTFKLRFNAPPNNLAQPSNTHVPSLNLYPPQHTDGNRPSISFTIDNRGRLNVSHPATSAGYDLGFQLRGIFQRHVYRFSAERLKVGSGAHGANAVLSRDASNLPEVLNQLQSNQSRFRDLNNQLSTILPQVRQVSVRPTGPSQVEIVVWCHDPESKRADLAVPLSESGTGIGQVLAILYVVLTSHRPQTIIIDEPQSFLHPGAARKLMEFLKRHSKHQFIVATHSATIISATKPTSIILILFQDGISTVRQLDVKSENGIQATLTEIGVRLSDLFGADNILWVEGRTEEKCFPIIIEKILGVPLMGTQVIGVRRTGDLEGRDARKVFEIYRDLADGATLLPPAKAFILDTECRDEGSKRELSKLSGGLAQFLPRRMFENYLLNTDALAALANSIDGFRNEPITPKEVQVLLQAKLMDGNYFCRAEKINSPEDRIKRVDAARVLEEIFLELSESRVEYQKVSHGVSLTEWLIAHAPSDLSEVAEMLDKTLNPSATAS